MSSMMECVRTRRRWVPGVRPSVRSGGVRLAIRRVGLHRGVLQQLVPFAACRSLPCGHASVANRFGFWQIAAFCTPKTCIAGRRVKGSATRLPPERRKPCTKRQWMAERQRNGRRARTRGRDVLPANAHGAAAGGRRRPRRGPDAGQGRRAHASTPPCACWPRSPRWSGWRPGRQFPGTSNAVLDVIRDDASGRAGRDASRARSRTCSRTSSWPCCC